MATNRREPNGFRADHSLRAALTSKGALVCEIVEAVVKGDEGAFRLAAEAFAKREMQSRHHVTARRLRAALASPRALARFERWRKRDEQAQAAAEADEATRDE